MILLMKAKILAVIFFLSCCAVIIAAEVPPVLEFPQEGMDDPAKYQNYVTRFFKDSSGNSFQIYIDQKSGRVVNLWADAANESASFTVRDAGGAPATIQWESNTATVSFEKGMRSVQYELMINSPTIQIGHTLLSSMRKERDFQYFQKHMEPFDSPAFHDEELKKLIANLEQLPEAFQEEHLKILKARDVRELQSRFDPQRVLIQQNGGWVANLNQISFDGKNHLALELSVGSKQTADLTKNVVSFRSTDTTSPIRLAVKVSTDSGALTPLDHLKIFNAEFMKFYESQKTAKDPIRFKWLDREVRGMQLLSSQEKLMAGLPNFATYFGRDTMMSSLMMEPIWTGTMLEHAIGSVLNKLAPDGAASHEEALGGQAIKENADKYNKLIDQYLQNKKDETLDQAKEVLKNLQKTNENYRMVDDDFQLPVLLARYLKRTDIGNEQKRDFLLRKSRQDLPFITLIIRNLIYVVNKANPYVENPIATNLVSFPQENGKWLSSSWRDSGVGYALGRFAMDVNTIWVPEALESISDIISEVAKVGFSITDLESRVPEIRETKLQSYAKDSAKLQNAIQTWKNSPQHFKVHLDEEQIRVGVKAKLGWLPEVERNYWAGVLANATTDKKYLDFLALSLDENGKPIPIVNTDPATLIFIEDFTDQILQGTKTPADVSALTYAFGAPYPLALFVDGLGPLCANDTFASPEVWEMFKKDLYHSPRVVWGREVNLYQLGLLKQIYAAYDGDKLKDEKLSTYVADLRKALKKTIDAVEASGLKHNELWTYKIENGKLFPIRYGTSSDVQLWNLTDLAVQFLLFSTQGHEDSK
jgi:hypothetical protein